MCLFCIFILLTGNTGNVQCNHKNENRFQFVFRKSDICSWFEEDSVHGHSIRGTSLEGLGGSVSLCYQAWVKWCCLVFIHVEGDAPLEGWWPLLEFTPKIWQFALYLNFTSLQLSLQRKNDCIMLHQSATLTALTWAHWCSCVKTNI